MKKFFKKARCFFWENLFINAGLFGVKTGGDKELWIIKNYRNAYNKAYPNGYFGYVDGLDKPIKEVKG